MTTADVEEAVIGRGPETGGAHSTRALARPSRALLAILRGLATEIAAQAARWVLWLPVAFGLGSAGYFALKVEPAPGAGAAAAVAGLASMLAARAIAGRRAASIALALVGVAALGFADARLTTTAVRAPVLPEGLGAVRVSGRVVDVVEAGAARWRLLLAPIAIEGVAPRDLPARIRVSLKEPLRIEPGDAISTLAILDPPPGPASPGNFDFARDAWFSRIGGVGLALTRPRFVRLAPPGPILSAQIWLNRLRWRLAERLAGDLGGGPAAGLAAAVTTSHQAWLPAGNADDLRASGLAHMLAIAGLHTAAVAGFVYAATRLFVAAWPWLALRVSGKRLAAAAGLVAVLGYLALSGAHPPARRAAITAGVAFLAMLAGRRVVSMRSLAVAALVVLALQPIAVVQPGFQMSFCATAALVALAELWPREAGRLVAPWWLAWPQRVRDWIVAMGMVSLVAGLATAPFALQHFNRMATWGLFANFAADLVASLVLMPALVLVVLGEALNLSPWVLALPVDVARGAADAVLGVAHVFATAPGAVHTMASAPDAALGVAFAAIVFACLWRGGVRWAALPFAAAVLLWPRSPPPSAWIAADGDNAAVVADGRAVVLKPLVRTFALNAWITHRGLATPFDPQAETDLAYACDRSGCAPKPGLRPALGAWWSRKRSLTAQHLGELCAESDIVIARGALPDGATCPGALLLTDRDLAWGGSAEIYGAPGAWRVDWAQTYRGDRPWSAPAVRVQPLPTHKRRTAPPPGPPSASEPALSDSGG